jgi:hypothetical protein
VRRLLALLRWVLGDDQDAGAPGQRRSDGDAPVGPRNVMKRLRLLLAECGQIVARNPYSFIEDRLCLEAIQEGRGCRMQESFKRLAMISNGDPENQLRYWA